MPKYDAYVLRIWRDDSRWAARLDHLPDGAALRFTSSGALLAYLNGTGASEGSDPNTRASTRVDGTTECQQTG